jgi:hypothetical protein
MVELADVLRDVGPGYMRAYGRRMLPSHRRAISDLAACRTPALGGSLYCCDRCEHLEYSYHSCRNRHCPKCHRMATEQWLEAVGARLLPCPYYLATFTLPEPLRALARSQQRILYTILMQEAARALQEVADDRRWVGGQLGSLAVLHTWSRNLSYHPHVHLLVTAGGLTADGEAWIKPAHPRFLFPGYVVSAVFRRRVLAALEKAGLAVPDPEALRRSRWVVHLRHVGSGHHALVYLSRYVHRIALTTQSIEGFEGGRVTYRYRCSRSALTKRCSFEAQAFLARFLQHVLPRGFTKVRYYGLLSPACRHRLERARALLAAHAEAIAMDPPAASRRARAEPASEVGEPSEEPRRCRICGTGTLRFRSELPRLRAPPR